MTATVRQLLVVLAAVTSLPVFASGEPELPRTTVDTTPPRPSGRTIPVRAGGDLQRALDGASPGDVIALEAGATFTGSFVLPNKAGTDWIVVRSSAEADLPPPGTRVTPSDARAMPKIVSATGEPAVRTAPGAHHVRFVGIEIAPAPGVYVVNLVMLGTGRETAVAELPHHIVFDRCYVHVPSDDAARRGVVMNSRSTAVIDSWLSGFKEAGADSQAILGWNGPGPFLIARNYLEAAGENIMFGGAGPAIPGLVPSDIEIRENHVTKRLAWNPHMPSVYAGRSWVVKNLLELKNARRVLVEDNVFEHSWAGGQSGAAIVLTPRGERGGAPWAVVQDVTFDGNIVRRAAGGIVVLGRDDAGPSGSAERLSITDSLFEELGAEAWGGPLPLLTILEGVADVRIRHVTAVHRGNIVTAEGATHDRFAFTDNVVVHNRYGIAGTGTATGLDTLQRYFPGAIVTRNVLVGGDAALYPGGNAFPPSLADAGVADPAARDYRLLPASPYRGFASDGRDPGADVGRLRDLVARVADSGPMPAGTVLTSVAADSPPPSAPGGERSVAAAVFWASVGALLYVHAGYPLLIFVLARLRRESSTRPAVAPHVTVIVVAYNEVSRISERLENLLSMRYPRDRLEVVVASDGSTDGTVARARRWERAGVRVIDFPARRGKPAVLNDVVPHVRGEIIVFADARQWFEPAAVAALVARFDDPSVGAVSGELMLAGRRGGVSGGVGVYWRYEKFIRRHESRFDSTVGATGAIYAIRRELYEEIAEDTILDDLLIPLRAVRRGARVVFEPRARAWDEVSETADEEWSRKVRTLAGNFQLFARESRWLLHPARNRLIFQTVSHKGLRLLCPVFLAAAFGANLLLAASPLYGVVLAGQIGFYAAALAGRATATTARRSRLLGIAYVFCLLNWATVVGFVRFVTGRQRVTWERAQDRVAA